MRCVLCCIRDPNSSSFLQVQGRLQENDNLWLGRLPLYFGCKQINY